MTNIITISPPPLTQKSPSWTHHCVFVFVCVCVCVCVVCMRVMYVSVYRTLLKLILDVRIMLEMDSQTSMTWPNVE